MTDKDKSDLFVEITGKKEVTEEQEKNDKRLRDDESDTRSQTNEQCPECENDRAFYEMKQIRAADESETRFFECTECSHKWREDDH